MPEHGRGRRILAVAAAGLFAAVLAAPAALAQIDQRPIDPREDPRRWAASGFDAPFDQPDREVRRQPFAVSGTLSYDKLGPADHIVQAEVRIVPAAGVQLADGCTLPEPVVVGGPGPQANPVAELAFAVGDLQLDCNGRYVVEVQATLDDRGAPTYTMSQPFTSASLPPAVTDLELGLDEEARTVTATFTPVPAAEQDPEAIGYVLERRGPDDGEESGSFSDIASIDVDDAPRFVDDLSRAAGGTYTYRVRTVRAAEGGPQRSSVLDTQAETITIGDPPEGGATTTPERGPRRGSVSISRGSTATGSEPRRPTTATTIDTGFEGTLDYGDVASGRPTTTDGDEGDQPLAGQSVIQDEGEGVDLAGPVAGALVLLGWAGHIAYLNRLARQL